MYGCLRKHQTALSMRCLPAAACISISEAQPRRKGIIRRLTSSLILPLFSERDALADSIPIQITCLCMNKTCDNLAHFAVLVSLFFRNTNPKVLRNIAPDVAAAGWPVRPILHLRPRATSRLSSNNTTASTIQFRTTAHLTCHHG